MSTRYASELQETHKLRSGGRMEKTAAANISHLLYETETDLGEITMGIEWPKIGRYSQEIPQGAEPSDLSGAFLFFGDKMTRIRKVIDQVANTDVTVLIQGESGVGKEIVARALHLNSNRLSKPFIKVNCAALPEELLESELFGYEKGAFTGAHRQHPGKFELAHGGTIFLDEIGDISPSSQAKLLQVLQDGEFSRLGGRTDIQVDVRVLVATNKNLEATVREGRFREDLYYRLNVVNILVPPLRERRQEIPIFVKYFLDIYGEKYSNGTRPPSRRLMRMFMLYRWPGNVRELENMVQRLVVLEDEAPIIEELDPDIKKRKSFQRSKPQPMDPLPPVIPLKEVSRRAIMQAEREAILKVLRRTNWNRRRAAELLNVSYKAILYKIKDYGITQ